MATLLVIEHFEVFDQLHLRLPVTLEVLAQLTRDRREEAFQLDLAPSMDPQVQRDVDKRVEERSQARSLVENGRLHVSADGFVWGRNDNNVDAALFPGVLPDATLILLVRPFPGESGRWECKLRLGPSAPPGLTLFDLQDTDPELSFGGRWKAGSNKYAADGMPRGTGVDPEMYAAALSARLSRCPIITSPGRF